MMSNIIKGKALGLSCEIKPAVALPSLVICILYLYGVYFTELELNDISIFIQIINILFTMFSLFYIMISVLNLVTIFADRMNGLFNTTINENK